MVPMAAPRVVPSQAAAWKATGRRLSARSRSPGPTGGVSGAGHGTLTAGHDGSVVSRDQVRSGTADDSRWNNATQLPGWQKDLLNG